MTKRKAIDRALMALPLSNHRFYREVLENLWNDARVATLRFAASCANEPSDAVKYRQWANALAKKARTKKH